MRRLSRVWSVDVGRWIVIFTGNQSFFAPFRFLCFLKRFIHQFGLLITSWDFNIDQAIFFHVWPGLYVSFLASSSFTHHSKALGRNPWPFGFLSPASFSAFAGSASFLAFASL
jgi:hypothetical protein